MKSSIHISCLALCVGFAATACDPGDPSEMGDAESSETTGDTAATTLGSTSASTDGPSSTSASTDPSSTSTSGSTGAETDPGTTAPDGLEIEVRCGQRSSADASAEELAALAKGDVEVGLALLGDLAEQDRPNVLLSPYSLRTAFAQTYAGAQGPSSAEIEEVMAFAPFGPQETHRVFNAVTLGLQGRNAEATDTTPALILRPINRAFLDASFSDAVTDTWSHRMQSDYGACIEVFDMNQDQAATLEHVNGWVAEQTNDQIDNLVKFLPQRVSLIIVNALYFNAAWKVPFESGLTEPASFTAWSGSNVTVDMMHAPRHAGSYAEGEGWQAVTVPYSSAALEMAVVLPELGTAAAFEASLTAARVEEIVAALDPAVVDLKLPKFDLLSAWGLRDPLTDLGMVSPFENADDFDPIAPGMDPIVEVFHDVAIAIDEKGTEASAATAVVFGDEGETSYETDPIASVVVDRPFYVIIRDKVYGTSLFFARIGDPTDG